jgi:tetratricopeptide (TPR) repeat protein
MIIGEFKLHRTLRCGSVARLRKALVLLGMGVFFASSALAQDALKEATSLVEAGNASAAYELLEPLEGERAGEPEFDYLLGISALEAGEAARAVFALERVLAMQPDNVQARAELARAYFLLRDDVLAKKEFENVKARPLPAEIKSTVDRYLDAIDSRTEDNKPTRISGYTGIGFGYDSNTNSATDEGTVALPAFGNQSFTLAADGVEQGSFEFVGEAGVLLRHRYGPRLTGFIGGDLIVHAPIDSDASDFDTATITPQIGASYRRGKHHYTIRGQAQWFQVDGDLFRDTYGVGGDWRWDFSQQSQVSLFARVSEIEYHPRSRQFPRDVTQLLFGIGGAHAFAAPGAPVAYASAYYGNEDTDNDGFSQFDRKFIGVRVGGQYSVRRDIDILASVNAEWAEHGGTEPLFLVERDDTLLQLSLAANYRPAAQWTITPVVRYIINESNVPTSDYSRATAHVKVRYDF